MGYSDNIMKDQCYEFVKGPNNKISIVGFGSYGEVKLAKNTETGQIVAIKMIHGRNAKEEIDVHHKLNHPNIIKLINYYYEKDKNMTYMVLEFAEGGSLHDKIKYGYGQLPKPKVKRYFRDVCKAIGYLHSLKYMHRDIKPENILMSIDDHCKLCDFGFAAILEYRSTLCGTYEYMAPEMIQEKPYDYKVDIWGLGILLFQLIQGSAPFRGETGQDVIAEMKKPIVFSNRFDKQEIDLIKMILRVGAEKRPDVPAILEHPFFKDMEDYEAEERQIEKAWNLDKEKTQERSTQPARSGSNWSLQNQMEAADKGKVEKPSSQPSQNYKADKEFKYFVPQGVKANPTLGTGKPTGLTPTSPNMSQGQYQNFSNSNQYSNPTSTPGLNSSSSSGYRSNQLPPGSFNPPPPQNKGLQPGVNVNKPISGLTSPPNGQRPNIPIYNAFQGQQPPPPAQGYSQGQWRKN